MVIATTIATHTKTSTGQSAATLPIPHFSSNSIGVSVTRAAGQEIVIIGCSPELRWPTSPMLSLVVSIPSFKESLLCTLIILTDKVHEEEEHFDLGDGAEEKQCEL